jgi:hypothetical protein
VHGLGNPVRDIHIFNSSNASLSLETGILVNGKITL